MKSKQGPVAQWLTRLPTVAFMSKQKIPGSIPGRLEKLLPSRILLHSNFSTGIKKGINSGDNSESQASYEVSCESKNRYFEMQLAVSMTKNERELVNIAE